MQYKDAKTSGPYYCKSGCCSSWGNLHPKDASKQVNKSIRKANKQNVRKEVEEYLNEEKEEDVYFEILKKADEDAYRSFKWGDEFFWEQYLEE